MITRGRIGLLTAAALGALAVAVVSGPPATSLQKRPTVRLVQGFVNTADVQGVIGAVVGGSAGAVRAFGSLHGLEPNSTYEVVAVNRPCRVDLSAEGVQAATVFQLVIETEDRGDVFASQRVTLERGLRSARSLRVYEREEEAEIRQLACRRAAVFIGGGAATGAIIGS